MVPSSPVFRFLIAGLGAACCVLVGTSCANYRLGTGGKLAFQTLYVAPVANKTLLPQANALLSSTLRNEFLQDGRVTLVDTPDQADATLAVTLVDYHREVATVQAGDTGLARQFALTLGATVTLHDNRSGQDLFAQRRVDAVRNDYTDSGQLQSEYQTLPLLAGVMAKKVAHAALDVW